MSRRRPMRRPVRTQTYTLLDELAASTVHPLPEATRVSQLSRMWEGLAAIERAPEPTVDDWRVCSDAVNLLESLIVMGELQDVDGLLPEAVHTIWTCGKRYNEGRGLRLDARGIFVVRSILEDYAEALAALPARTMIQAHRRTERRIQEIQAGRKQPHDVTVMAL